MENKQIQGLDVNGAKPTVAVPNQLNDLNDGNTVLTKSSSSNKVYATDNSGNQTTLSYSQGINDGASIVQRDENGRITAQDPANNTDVANKLYVDTVFDGSQKALAYADYDTMITAFNDFSDSDYKVGQNVYIRTLNVPDLWVYSVEDTYSAYTYVDDATFIAGLTNDGYVQVGYYKLAQLETQNANISNVKAGDIDSESATNGQVLTANGSGGANWGTISAVTLDTTTQAFEGSKTLTIPANNNITFQAKDGNTNKGTFDISLYTDPALYLKRAGSNNNYLKIMYDHNNAPNIQVNHNNWSFTYYFRFPKEEIGSYNNRVVAGLEDIAPRFSTSQTYNVGDIVVYGQFAKDYKLYVCTTAITTAGSWDASKWTEVSNLVDALKTKIPNAPTTDGTYTLKVVVSSGVPTYQWVLDV